MEAHPLSFVALKENIPFLCLKYNSDGVDGKVADDWSFEVHNVARAIETILTSAGLVVK